MLGGVIRDRVDSITDLLVVMDSRMSFSMHIDVTIEKALAMLGVMKIFQGALRDPYTFTTLVRPKLEYASCIWRWVCRKGSLDMCCENWDGRTCMIFLHTYTVKTEVSLLHLLRHRRHF
jgi:hypothetical protein